MGVAGGGRLDLRPELGLQRVERVAFHLAELAEQGRGLGVALAVGLELEDRQPSAGIEFVTHEIEQVPHRVVGGLPAAKIPDPNTAACSSVLHTVNSRGWRRVMEGAVCVVAGGFSPHPGRTPWGVRGGRMGARRGGRSMPQRVKALWVDICFTVAEWTRWFLPQHRLQWQPARREIAPDA